MRPCLSAALLTLLPSFAVAQLSPSCPAAAGIEETEDLAALPEPVAASLKEHVPNLTPPGSPFNGSDVLRSGQTGLDRRLIAAFHRGNRWVIAYEAAGEGYHDVVAAYDLSANGQEAAIVSKTQAVPANLCGAISHALASKRGAIDRYW
jgi:hypothetical protein